MTTMQIISKLSIAQKINLIKQIWSDTDIKFYPGTNNPKELFEELMFNGGFYNEYVFNFCVKYNFDINCFYESLEQQSDKIMFENTIREYCRNLS